MPSSAALPAVAAPALDRAALRREILRLAWPVVLQALLRTAMFWVDTAMLSAYGQHGLAAVALVGPVAHTLSMVLAALGVGALATVARATGARDDVLQEREAATSVALALALGAALLAVAVPVYPQLARFLVVPDSPEVNRAGAEYLRWIVYAIPFMLLDSAGMAVLRAAGDTRTPMFVAILSNAVNVVGNYALIFGRLGAPEMGVPGAGLSTAIAIAVQGTLMGAWLFTRGARIRLRPRSFALVTGESARRLIRVSLPAAVEPLMLQAGFLVFIAMMGRLGEDALAAHRVAVTIESISFMPAWGLSIACGAIVGQYLGARRPDKSAAGLAESVRIAAVVMVPLGVVFALLAGPLARIFLETPAAAEACAWCLRIASVEQFFLAAALVLGGALRGAGDTRSPVAVGMLGVWAVRVPLSYVFAFTLGLGIAGAWIVMVIDWSARAAAFAWFWRRGRWKTITL